MNASVISFLDPSIVRGRSLEEPLQKPELRLNAVCHTVPLAEPRLLGGATHACVAAVVLLKQCTQGPCGDIEGLAHMHSVSRRLVQEVVVGFLRSSRFPLADVVPDRPHRVVVSPNQLFREKRKQGVGASVVDRMRSEHRLYRCSHLRWQIEAEECSRAGGMPVGEETHFVPLPPMSDGLRSMHCHMGVEVTEIGALAGHVGRERSFHLEFLERLLDDEPRPVCWNLVSNAWGRCQTRSTDQTAYCTLRLPDYGRTGPRIQKSRSIQDASCQRRTRGSSASL